MALFGHKDPLKHGQRSSAYIERVAATAKTKTVLTSDSAFTVNASESALVLRFAGSDGATVVYDHHLWGVNLPLPGSTVDIGYFPDKLEDLVIDWLTLVAPRADEPRGWSAGIFAVDPMGSMQSDPADRATLEAQRELFRSGHRARGTFTMGGITSANESVRRGTFHWAGSIRIDDIEHHLDLWVPSSSAPEAGDEIEVAVSADGSHVALDSDERFDAPPGQALVLVHPPAGTPEPTEAEVLQASNARMAELQTSGSDQRWLTQLGAIENLANVLAQGGMDEASFAIPKGQIVSRLVALPVSPLAASPELLARIDGLHAAGALTDADVAALRARWAVG
jgi:hypothetical protein